MRDIESIKTLLETSIYNKPHLSCEEQLVLLEHRGVKIENKKFALEQLETISYYSLINAYSPLFKQENGQYEGNVTFNDFYMCYKYDTRLKNIIFKYIILIEQTLKPIYLPLLLKIMVFKNPLLKERLQTKKGSKLQDMI